MARLIDGWGSLDSVIEFPSKDPPTYIGTGHSEGLVNVYEGKMCDTIDVYDFKTWRVLYLLHIHS